MDNLDISSRVSEGALCSVQPRKVTHWGLGSQLLGPAETSRPAEAGDESSARPAACQAVPRTCDHIQYSTRPDLHKKSRKKKSTVGTRRRRVRDMELEKL